jgi:putative colanic acid biosynthesis acetyltransferase WcaF
MSYTRLQKLQPPSSLNRLLRVFWSLTWTLFARPTPRFLHSWRRLLLKVFGAKISKGVFVYPHAKIWAPWNLIMERGSCLADEVDCYNVATIHLEEGVTVSQKSFLCTASHDFDSPYFPLVGGGIRIRRGAWVAADAFIGPGVSIGERAVVLARSVIVRDVEPGTVVGGNPGRVLRNRA